MDRLGLMRERRGGDQEVDKLARRARDAFGVRGDDHPNVR